MSDERTSVDRGDEAVAVVRRTKLGLRAGMQAKRLGLHDPPVVDRIGELEEIDRRNDRATRRTAAAAVLPKVVVLIPSIVFFIPPIVVRVCHRHDSYAISRQQWKRGALRSGRRKH